MNFKCTFCGNTRLARDYSVEGGWFCYSVSRVCCYTHYSKEEIQTIMAADSTFKYIDPGDFSGTALDELLEEGKVTCTIPDCVDCSRKSTEGCKCPIIGLGIIHEDGCKEKK